MFIKQHPTHLLCLKDMHKSLRCITLTANSHTITIFKKGSNVYIMHLKTHLNMTPFVIYKHCVHSVKMKNVLPEGV